MQINDFDEVTTSIVTITLNSLKIVNEKLLNELDYSGATALVRGIQIVKYQKAIFVIGIFSMFDSQLQECFGCKNGFKTTGEFLKNREHYDLENKFRLYILAINVLKHGHGRSYDALKAKNESLPFKLNFSERTISEEGDISLISTLIDVDDKFVKNCGQIINEIYNVIRNSKK